MLACGLAGTECRRVLSLASDASFGNNDLYETHRNKFKAGAR